MPSIPKGAPEPYNNNSSADNQLPSASVGKPSETKAGWCGKTVTFFLGLCRKPKDKVDDASFNSSVKKIDEFSGATFAGKPASASDPVKKASILANSKPAENEFKSNPPTGTGEEFKHLPAAIDIDSQCSYYGGYGGYTALTKAASDGDYNAVKALIAKGADVNKPAANGLTPLMNAIKKGRVKIVELLLKVNAKVDMPKALQEAENGGSDKMAGYSKDSKRPAKYDEIIKLLFPIEDKATLLEAAQKGYHQSHRKSPL